MTNRLYVLGEERLPRQFGSWDLRGVYTGLPLAIIVANKHDWFIIPCPPDHSIDVDGEYGERWFPAREPVPEGFL